MNKFQKVIETLREVQAANVRQITGEYVELDEQEQPCGYCVMGWLYAQAGPDILRPTHGENRPLER